jgi:hypothetical protein
MQTTKMFYWYGKLQPRDVATKVTFITPLSSLTQEKVKWKWTPVHQEAFDQMKVHSKGDPSHIPLLLQGT